MEESSMNLSGHMARKPTSKSFLLCMAVLLVLGAGLRLRAISSFEFYTDSYNFMLMAQEFVHSGRMNGTLGPAGEIFIPSPSPFYKWGYSLMMSLPVALGVEPEWAGHGVAFLAGILCPLAAFAFLLGLSHKTGVALAGFALMIFSYDAVTWSGFVLTDVPALATGLLGLALLTHAKRGVHWVLSGLLIGWAAIERSELLSLALPCLLILLNQRSGVRAFVGVMMPLFALFIIVTAILGSQIPQTHFIMGGTTDSLFDKIFGRFSDIGRVFRIKHLLRFALAEGPIVLCAGLGLLILVRDRHRWFLLLFVVLVGPLTVLYNASLEHHRYYTQILPGLLIPASLWLGQREEWVRVWPGRPWVGKACLGLAVAGMVFQAVEIARRGHRQQDYPGEVGQWVASLEADGRIQREDVVFTIDERAIHFRTGLSCRSLRASPPHLDMEGLTQSSRMVFVVDDYLVYRRIPGFREALERGGAQLLGRMESVALLDDVYGLEEDDSRGVEAWRVPWVVAKDIAAWSH